MIDGLQTFGRQKISSDRNIKAADNNMESSLEKNRSIYDAA